MTMSIPDVMKSLRIDGKVAIVTGGAGQLGSQMCDALAEAGAHVVVASRNLDNCQRKAAELSGRHAEAIAIAADVTVPESVKAMVEVVLERFARIDILVNSAYSGVSNTFEKMSLEEFESATRGVLSSAFLCSQGVAPAMKAQGAGAIINIASIYGLVSPDHSIYGNSEFNSPCNYGAAKAGLIQFTRWLAVYLASFGVRVNSITPGGFYSEQYREVPDYEDVFVRNYCQRTPLGRMGDEGDLKGAIVYLASDASRYVTGHNLVVDGGWTVW